MEPGSTLLVQVGQHKGGIVFVHKGFTDPETQTPRVKDKTHFWKKNNPVANQNISIWRLGVPPNHPFRMGLSMINYPAIEVPPLEETSHVFHPAFPSRHKAWESCRTTPGTENENDPSPIGIIISSWYLY